MNKKEVRKELVKMGFDASLKGIGHMADILEMIDKKGSDFKITATIVAMGEKKRIQRHAIERNIRYLIQRYYEKNRGNCHPHLYNTADTDGQFRTKEFLIRLHEIIYDNASSDIAEIDRKAIGEIPILMVLSQMGMRWIARDEDGSLIAHERKPVKKERDLESFATSRSYWMAAGSSVYRMHFYEKEDYFREIRWHDDEPTSVRDLLLEKKAKLPTDMTFLEFMKEIIGEEAMG